MSEPLSNDERVELERLRAERVAIQNDSQTLTCVYCGHQYPPGTPPSNHHALTQHIRHCSKHPMKAAFDLITRVKAHLETEQKHSGYVCEYSHERNELLKAIEHML